jgi:hypothetical protein
VLVGLLAVLAASPALAQDEPRATAEPEENTERIGVLEQQIKILAGELDRLRKAAAVPEDRKLESFSGLGPGASKVYFRDRGLSIGSYGEIRFRYDIDGSDSNVYDALRAVLYVGYKFTDWLVVNSEFEFEHAGTGGGGSASVEFLTIDFLPHEAANLRAGLVLIPMGFLNEIHEPTFYFGAERPEPELRIIPTTWRENGVGLFGTIANRVHYRAYVVNGFDATGFTDNGLRGGRQKGSRALANDVAGVLRIDYEPLAGLLLGGSAYYGNSGQDQTSKGIPEVPTLIWEVHAQYRAYGLSLRALWTQARLWEAGELSTALGLGIDESVAEKLYGGYLEAGYDVLPLVWENTKMSLEPFYRFEYLDTQRQVASGKVRNRNLKRHIHTVGLSYKPHPNVVIKIDYRDIIPKGGASNEREVQFGLGYVF